MAVQAFREPVAVVCDLKARFGVKTGCRSPSVDDEKSWSWEMDLITTDMPSQSKALANHDYIEHCNGRSDLGEIAIARSSLGICAILFGSGANELRNDLAARFPNSKLVRNDGRLRDDLSKVVRFVAAPKT